MQDKNNEQFCIKSFFKSMDEVVYSLDINTGNINWINHDSGDIKISADVETDDSFNELVKLQDIPKRKNYIYNIMKSGYSTDFINYCFKCADGNYIDVKETAKLVCNADGSKFIYGRIKKVTDQDIRYEKDNITGLYSRKWFIDRLEELIGGNDTNCGHVLAIGIDRLAMYNEAFNADMADEVIGDVAKRLNIILGECGIIARVAGDIFCVALKDKYVEQVSSVVSQLFASFRNLPIETSEGNIFVTISIGGSSYRVGDGGCVSAKNLVVRAELALQDAKNGGRGRYMEYEFSNEQKQEYRKWLRTSDELLNALGGNRIVLAFQPVMSVASNSVSFYECLVRMVNPEGEFVSAGNFMPIIEHMGTARMVDLIIVKMAMDELKVFPELSLSINVSAWTLEDPSWIRYVISELIDFPEIAERIIIEITETVAFKDMKTAKTLVDTLHGLGARVALDDFGSGHTSFKQIKELGVDIVKIDKSFVKNIGNTSDDRIFVQTLQKLADTCHVETVGEGAETISEADMLKKDGVTYIQGYVHGFPSVERLWLDYDHVDRIPNNVRRFQKNLTKSATIVKT